MPVKFDDEDLKHFLKLQFKCFSRNCFFNDKDCSEKIIKAHSIQNNTILRRISRNGNVCCFDTKSSYFVLHGEVSETGRKKASTFTGLCGHHDKVVFQPIEDKPFTGDKDQQFLFALRAFIKEYYEKTCIEQFIVEWLDFVRNRYIEILGPDYQREMDEYDKRRLSFFEGSLLGTRNALSRHRFEKIAFLANYRNRRSDRINTYVRITSDEKPMAVCSPFYLEFDLEGKRVNDPSDLKEKCQPIFLNVFPQDGQMFYLFGCYTKSSRKYEQFFNQIRRLPDSDIFPLISRIITLYCENFFLSPDYWDSLNEQTRVAFVTSFRSTHYGTIEQETLIKMKPFFN